MKSWYLAFTTSGRTAAKAVRPVISGNFYYISLWRNQLCCAPFTMFFTKILAAKFKLTFVSTSARQSRRNWSKNPFDFNCPIMLLTTTGSAGVRTGSIFRLWFMTPCPICYFNSRKTYTIFTISAHKHCNKIAWNNLTSQHELCPALCHLMRASWFSRHFCDWVFDHILCISLKFNMFSTLILFLKTINLIDMFSFTVISRKIYRKYSL